MPDLMDRDGFTGLAITKPVNAMIVEFTSYGSFVIQRSDLPALLEIASRAVQVRRPDIKVGERGAWENKHEPVDEGRTFISIVQVDRVVPTGTAAALAASAAVAETLPEVSLRTAAE